MTITSPRASSPSISESNWPTTRFSTSPPSSRLPAIESISSKKMIAGPPRWPARTRPVKLLRLAFVLRHDLRAVDGDERRVDLVGDGAGDQRLPGPRRAVEQDALRRVDPEPGEHAGLRAGARSSRGLTPVPRRAADVLVGRARGVFRRGSVPPGGRASVPEVSVPAVSVLAVSVPMDLSDEGPLPVEDPEAVRRSAPRPRRSATRPRPRISPTRRSGS